MQEGRDLLQRNRAVNYWFRATIWLLSNGRATPNRWFHSLGSPHLHLVRDADFRRFRPSKTLARRTRGVRTGDHGRISDRGVLRCVHANCASACRRLCGTKCRIVAGCVVVLGHDADGSLPLDSLCAVRRRLACIDNIEFASMKSIQLARHRHQQPLASPFMR
jgi:hypothetical protein